MLLVGPPEPPGVGSFFSLLYTKVRGKKKKKESPIRLTSSFSPYDLSTTSGLANICEMNEWMNRRRKLRPTLEICPKSQAKLEAELGLEPGF